MYRDDKRTYGGIDVMKFLMAMVVVGIHTYSIDNVTNSVVYRFLQLLEGSAVPFFFLASGFFLFKAGSDEVSEMMSIQRQLIKIVKMYFIWSCIYIPLAVYGYYIQGRGLVYSVFDYIYGLFVRGDHYNSWTLWYLMATAYTLMLIKFLKKKKFKMWYIVIFGVMVSMMHYFFSAGVTGGERYISKMLNHLFGRVLGGVLYIPTGIWLANVKRKNVIGYMLLLSALGGAILSSGFAKYLFEILFYIGVFVIFSFQTKERVFYSVLRKLSKIIYLIHLYVWTLLCLVLYGKMNYSFSIFCCTCIFSILIGLGCILFLKIRRSFAEGVK